MILIPFKGDRTLVESEFAQSISSVDYLYDYDTVKEQRSDRSWAEYRNPGVSLTKVPGLKSRFQILNKA